MSLYFSAAVWSSLALCVFYFLLGNHLPRYRADAVIESSPPQASAAIGKRP